ncbi:MAG: hypothetical protein ACYCXT_00130 [Acidiferrobacteraceae bacterium]
MKSRGEIMLAWWLVLTVLGWAGDLFLHVPQALAWIHSTWHAAGFEYARGLGSHVVLLTIIKSLPVGALLIPLTAAMIVGLIVWYIGPGGDDDTGVQRGSTVTDASTLARIIKRRKS